MILALIKVLIALTHPAQSDAWADEQAHVSCYNAVCLDLVCGDGDSYYCEGENFAYSEDDT